MADIYHAKSNPERDVAYACELYEKAARGGSKSAEAKLDEIKSIRQDYFCRADALEESDPKTAYRYFAISTAMGYLPASIRLARAYAVGIGTEISRPDAFYWYKYAADAGLEDAYFPLGVCYARGVGTNFDYDLAMKYLGLAHSFGEMRAEREMRRIGENKRKRGLRKIYSTAMRLVYQKKFDVACEYLELASRLGNPRATYTLGCLYEFGRGVECDKSRAYALYDAAMRASFSDPRSSYKLTVLKMLKRN
jgi:TPR repeat protein